MQIVKDMEIARFVSLVIGKPDDKYDKYYVGLVIHQPKSVPRLTHAEWCVDLNDAEIVYKKRALFNGQNAQRICRRERTMTL